jgi:hypothetical protein
MTLPTETLSSSRQTPRAGRFKPRRVIVERSVLGGTPRIAAARFRLARSLLLHVIMTRARCACGHTRNDPQVLPEPFYTGWGWLLFLIGVTAKPLAVLYRCLWCKQILARSRDPQILPRFD